MLFVIYFKFSKFIPYQLDICLSISYDQYRSPIHIELCQSSIPLIFIEQQGLDAEDYSIPSLYVGYQTQLIINMDFSLKVYASKILNHYLNSLILPVL